MPTKINYFSLWHVDRDEHGAPFFKTQLERIFDQAADYFLLPKTTLKLTKKMSVHDAIRSFATQRGLSAHALNLSHINDALVPIIAKYNEGNELALLIPQAQGKFFVFLHSSPGFVIDKEKIATLFSEFVQLFMVEAEQPTILNKSIKRFFPRLSLDVVTVLKLGVMCGFFLVISQLVVLENSDNLISLLFGAAIFIGFIFFIERFINFICGKNYSAVLMLSYSAFYQRYLSAPKEQFLKIKLATMIRLKESLRKDVTRYFLMQSTQSMYLIIIVLHLFLLLWWNPIASLFYAVFVCCIIFLKQWLKNKQALLRAELIHFSDQQSHFIDVLESTFSMLVSLGGMKPVLKHIAHEWNSKRELSNKLLLLYIIVHSLKFFIPLISMIVCLVGLSWWKSELSRGDVVLLLVDALVVGFSLAALKERGQPLNSSTINALDEIPVIPSGLRVLPVHITGRIELINVSFNYHDSGVAVLKKSNLTIESGGMYQVLGPSGAGKSTLLKLASGSIIPSSGQVLFDGQDVRSLNLDVTKANFGVITQESQLFLGSIYDNIVCGRDIRKKNLERLLLSHEVFDMLLDMPMGLQSYVFPQKNLSRAQTLTVLLARALIHEPKILFMDEIFKGIDEHEQKIIVDFLNTIPITRILVTHRLVEFSNSKIINIQSSMIKMSS